MPRTTVVICTFNRPGPLARAIATARAQALPAGEEAEVLVVDNSPDANARAAVEAMMPAPGLPLRFLAVPEPNISLARNAGVAASTGERVAFLDDDERCEPGWLAALVATQAATGADLVFGAVLPEFPGGPPAWDPTGRSYERLLSWPTGTALTLRHDESVSGRWIGTGNSLLLRATCLDGPAPFDPFLGRCGGEDFDLFLRLFAQGRRFVWCAEAVVHELVPPERATLAYMRGRNFRTGQIYGTVLLRRSGAPRRDALLLQARAAAQLGVVGLRWALAALRGGGRPAALLSVKFTEVAGKLTWWRLARASRA
ncbi:glycosyltransferase family 2 protein [Roseococcus sp. DSY-14]|uniref:glycosyltransferase family 2 protein n=1 Tax=Roseococcus sp. DSY-14 TaxID=3369650 RepID=UPI00387AAF29